MAVEADFFGVGGFAVTEQVDPAGGLIIHDSSLLEADKDRSSQINRQKKMASPVGLPFLIIVNQN